MTENKRPFEPTHVFTHKYAKEHVLRKYLVGTAGIREDQFRIQVSFIPPFDGRVQMLSFTQTQDNELQLQVDEPAKLDDVSRVRCG